MSRADLIRRLIVTGHLNMEDRAALGDCLVGADELEHEIAASLGESPYFPPQAIPGGPQDAVFEGWYLERVGPRVRLHHQRANPTMPNIVADHTSQDQPDIQTAVCAYLRAAYAGEIDGIAIELPPAPGQPRSDHARLWALLMLGAGFALRGRAVPSALLMGLNFAGLSALLWFGLAFDAVSLFATIGILGVWAAAMVVEQLTLPRWRLGGRPPWLRRYVSVAVAEVICAIAIFAILLCSVRLMRTRGSGISTTATPGEFLLYSRLNVNRDPARGALLTFTTSAQASPAFRDWLIIGRVLAVPGDRLSCDSGYFVVNDKRTVPFGPTGRAPAVLDVPNVPQSLTVPADSFFIVQDNSATAYDSRVFNWALSSRIQGTSFLSLTLGRLGQPVR